jgi:DNA-binding transcriptional MerR regulator
LNNNIKTEFTIKDLENLSGVKAHTLRIWEKRYNLLNPQRTDTNIRYYDIVDLQRLLNVSLLYNNGYKISKIAALEKEQLLMAVREFVVRNENADYAIGAFKLAMINFDHSLFNQTYNQLSLKKSFSEIFLSVFVKLLNEVGVLWQTSTITPAHEHFISNLIKQKLHIQIEKAQGLEAVKKEQVFVLFLPLNEIHELGLMFVHMYLLLNGYSSIYLGQSVPIESLIDFHKLYDKVNFVSLFTVMPYDDEILGYINEVETKLIRGEQDKLFVLGRENKLSQVSESQNIKRFFCIQDFMNEI